LGLPLTAVIFEPQPNEYFAPEQAPPRLTRLREKLWALRDCEVERVLCLRFAKPLASMSPHAFVSTILVDGLGVRHLAVGDDFRFGADRRGDYAFLEREGQRVGFGVQGTATVALEGERVSSTRIRRALAVGDLDLVERLLGRRYSILGRVVNGEQRGRELGFPTANVDLHREASPLRGVFAVAVKGLDRDSLPGVANVGHRPTLGGHRDQLEVHIFDFADSIYGEHLEVEFQVRLRDERRFDSLEALKTQISSDALAARQWFAESPAEGGH
jgi:riboflavin kinase/FMN adenylyltransferase